MTQTKVTKAVIAAAGLGTRFLPQTKAMPKEMLPLIDKPIIQHIVEELTAAGITAIISALLRIILIRLVRIYVIVWRLLARMNYSK
jgi:choline kinase